MADEPTGALDSKTGRDILDLFEKLHQERGITIIVVTHDPNVARRANRVVSIRDGRIESDLGNEHYAATKQTHEGHESHEGIHVAAPVALATAVAVNGKPAVVAPVAVSEVKHEVTVLPAQTDLPSTPNAVPEEDTPVNVEVAVNPTPAKASAGPLWKRGLIAVAIATVVNVVIGLLAGVLAPFAGRLPFFSPLVIAGVTLLLGVIAVALFAWLNHAMSQPVKVFRIVAAGALALSLVPGVLFLTNPRMMLQFAGTSQSGQFAGAPSGQAGQLPNAQAAGGNTPGGNTTGGQGNGNFQNRGVPGLGPLGILTGGNTPGAARRANGGLFTALPAILLMLMPLLSFAIIVPALTRKPRNTAPKLNTSGLT